MFSAAFLSPDTFGVLKSERSEAATAARQKDPNESTGVREEEIVSPGVVGPCLASRSFFATRGDARRRWVWGREVTEGEVGRGR